MTTLSRTSLRQLVACCAAALGLNPKAAEAAQPPRVLEVRYPWERHERVQAQWREGTKQEDR